MFAIHVCAENTKNGNPRRLFLVCNSEGIPVKVIDEGYKGEGAIREAFPGQRIPVTIRINTPVATYNEFKRLEGKA